MLVVEINQKDGGLQAVKRGENTRYHQNAYLHTGQAYPLPFKINLQEPVPYGSGKFNIDPLSFRIGKYGDLELDPYGFKLVPLDKAA